MPMIINIILMTEAPVSFIECFVETRKYPNHIDLFCVKD